MIRYKITATMLTMLTSLSLMGCNDNSEAYKQRIQQDNDRRNPTGNKAICLSVGRIPKNGYPYTIRYIEGEKDPNAAWDPIFWNKDLNLKLSLYTKQGLFTEELIGNDNGKPLYRYQLTPEGEKYAVWWRGSGNEKTYLCFGRIVIDEIKSIDDYGVNSKRVYFQYHYENIPDWIKPKDIYSLYYPNITGEKDVTGQKLSTYHEYFLNSDGSLGNLIRGASGGYTL